MKPCSQCPFTHPENWGLTSEKVLEVTSGIVPKGRIQTCHQLIKQGKCANKHVADFPKEECVGHKLAIHGRV